MKIFSRFFIFSILFALGAEASLQAQPYIPTRQIIDLLDAIEKQEEEKEEEDKQPAPNNNNNDGQAIQIACEVYNIVGSCWRIYDSIFGDDREPVDGDDNERNYPAYSCYREIHPLTRYLLQTRPASERGPGFSNNLFNTEIYIENSMSNARWRGIEFPINPAWNLTADEFESDQVQEALTRAATNCFNYHDNHSF